MLYRIVRCPGTWPRNLMGGRHAGRLPAGLPERVEEMNRPVSTGTDCDVVERESGTRQEVGPRPRLPSLIPLPVLASYYLEVIHLKLRREAWPSACVRTTRPWTVT